MNKHATLNRFYRLVWSDRMGAYVVAAENVRGRGKRAVGSLCAALLTTVAVGALAAPPNPPAPTQLPTGGQVVAGGGAIAQAGARMDVTQTTPRAIINWNTFNVGSQAHVNFNQPSASAVALNRVLDTQASQILGRLTANGQVFLVNPNGVYFGRTASVDVGGLVASTLNIKDADFMAGNMRFTRDGATGSVVNEGEIRAALKGYIALLAPEVRNEGVIIAQMGTVALAAGDAVSLDFDGNNSLAGIVVEPSTLRTLVENKGAVIAPGGLIILSAQALDRIQGGVVRNSGKLEATGMAMRGGKIVLEASDKIENTGTISANAGSDGSPAGQITLAAPQIDNQGQISASGAQAAPGAAQLLNGGTVDLAATTITQSQGGLIDASGGAQGGSVRLEATADVKLAGRIEASGDTGGSVAIQGGNDIQLHSATVDASGRMQGGSVRIAGGQRRSPVPEPTQLPPTVAILGSSSVRAGSRRGQGGSISVTGEQVGLFDDTEIDVSGATGGGTVNIGGGFQGKDATLYNASQVVVAVGASIAADALDTGKGGKVVVWSNDYTGFGGSITARGGRESGAGGSVEVSGKDDLNFIGTVDASAANGKAGELLLDPLNITIQTGGGDAISPNPLTFTTNPATHYTIDPATITAIANAGTAVTLQANGDITVNNSIVSSNASGNGGALTFTAGRSISINADIVSDNGAITLNVNNDSATSTVGGTANFTNLGHVDAGSGNLVLTFGSRNTIGTISTGFMSANNLTINSAKTTLGGALVLGQTVVDYQLKVYSGGTDITNPSGTVVNIGTTGVPGRTTLDACNSGATICGSITISNAATNLNELLANGQHVTLVDTNAVQLGTSTVRGNLNVTTYGPIGSTGAIQVTGTSTFTAHDGGFGTTTPYLSLTNASNHFGGTFTATIETGSATVVDSGAMTLGVISVGTDLTLTTAGAITGHSTITVPTQTIITAGSGNNITLDNASNNFNGIRIISGKDVALVDQNAIMFGSAYGNTNYTSHIYGNLDVTAGPPHSE